MFKKTIAALKAAEAAVQEDLAKLTVPYNEKDGSGGYPWHAAGSGILDNAAKGLAGLRESLEKRQALEDAAAAEQAKADAAAKAQADAAADAGAAEVDATDTALEHAKTMGIDITTIKGTGKDGRITKSDVEAAVAAKEEATA